MKPAILLLLLSISCALLCQVTPSKTKSDGGLPTTSDIWTAAEKEEFRGCVSRLSADKERTRQVGAGVWCELWAEHKHWMSAHPEVAGQKENSLLFRKCNRDHAAQMNGTPHEFHAAFDQCMRKAYGLPETKQ